MFNSYVTDCYFADNQVTYTCFYYPEVSYSQADEFDLNLKHLLLPESCENGLQEQNEENKIIGIAKGIKTIAKLIRCASSLHTMNYSFLTF